MENYMVLEEIIYISFDATNKEKQENFDPWKT